MWTYLVSIESVTVLWLGQEVIERENLSNPPEIFGSIRVAQNAFPQDLLLAHRFLLV